MAKSADEVSRLTSELTAAQDSAKVQAARLVSVTDLQHCDTHGVHLDGMHVGHKCKYLNSQSVFCPQWLRYTLNTMSMPVQPLYDCLGSLCNWHTKLV